VTERAAPAADARMAPGAPAPSSALTPLTGPRRGLQRQLMLSFTLFALGMSTLLGLLTAVLLYSLEDRFIGTTLARAAADLERQHQATGQWPAPTQPFLQRHDTPASLPGDLLAVWQPEPSRNEYSGRNGRHYQLHWLGRPQGAPPDPPVPSARHPLLVAEVSGLLMVRPLRSELLMWWAAGSGLLTLAALALAAWRARRISRPLVRLANVVAHSQPGDRSPPAVTEPLQSRDDEVGLLARHLEALRLRTQSFIEREQTFTRDASHELRTPLAVLGMASARLLRRTDLPADALTEIQQMRQVLWDMEQTVNTLLALARETRAPSLQAPVAGDAASGTANDGILAPAPLALLPLLERVVLDQVTRLQGKEIQLELDVSPALRVALPPGVLHILLSNLVGNAFAHGESGPVQLHADLQGLTLQNRSPALPRGLGSHWGQPFQKGEGSAGFGLGLAIVRRLAEHQGLALQLSQPEGHIRVQLLWAPKASLAEPARPASP